MLDSREVVVETYSIFVFSVSVIPIMKSRSSPARPITSKVILLKVLITLRRAGSPCLVISPSQTLRSCRDVYEQARAWCTRRSSAYLNSLVNEDLRELSNLCWSESGVLGVSGKYRRCERVRRMRHTMTLLCIITGCYQLWTRDQSAHSYLLPVLIGYVGVSANCGTGRLRLRSADLL